MTTDNEQTTLSPCPWCKAVPLVERDLTGPIWIHIHHKTDCVLAPPVQPRIQYIPYASADNWNSYTRVSAASTAPVVDHDASIVSQTLSIAAERAAERVFAIMERYCVCSHSHSTGARLLSVEELEEIQQRRVAMHFPSGRPTGPWLDIDRLLAHTEALRLAVNVRTRAIKTQLETINELHAAASPAAPAEDWKSIDTAPRNGAAIIVGREHHTSQSVRWMISVDKGAPNGGWFVGGYNGRRLPWEPTHWTELPRFTPALAAPQEDAERILKRAEATFDAQMLTATQQLTKARRYAAHTEESGEVCRVNCEGCNDPVGQIVRELQSVRATPTPSQPARDAQITTDLGDLPLSLIDEIKERRRTLYKGFDYITNAVQMKTDLDYALAFLDALPAAAETVGECDDKENRDG